jgi:putative transposase
MKNGRYSDAQIMAVLKQSEGGVPVSELHREHRMSSANFYKWRAKLGGMDASLISEMKDMAEECRRPKRMYAEISMQIDRKRPIVTACRVNPYSLSYCRYCRRY